MNYYDVFYKSPAGYSGTHYAVYAVNQYEAAKISSIMLCYGTNWNPVDFTVLDVQLSNNIPI